MGCISEKCLKVQAKKGEKNLQNCSDSQKNKKTEESSTENQQRSKIQIQLQFFEENISYEEPEMEFKTGSASSNPKLNYFPENDRKFLCNEQKYLCEYQEQQLPIKDKNQTEKELENEIKEAVQLYGKKYPVQSGDLRETQIFVINSDLSKMIGEDYPKPLRVSLKKGTLSVIMEESEISTNRSNFKEGKDNQIIVYTIQDFQKNPESKIQFKRPCSVLKI